MTKSYLPRNFFKHTATVYADTGVSGGYDVVDKTGLACRLEPVNQQPATTGGQRADLASHFAFKYDPTYTLPENSQVDVGGQRYQVVPSTVYVQRHDDGPAIYGRALLVQVRA